MPLRSVDVARLADTVMAQFEGLIESGEWPVGTRIPPEPQLVEQLGVGRSTVREAVRALEHAGLLEARRGDGTYVRANSGLSAALLRRTRRATALEVLEVRDSIERDAARHAARRRTDEDIARIERALSAQDSARESGDLGAFIRADTDFHRAVIAATHNQVLIDLWESLSHALESGVRTVMADVHRAHSEFPGHGKLAAAIAEGDAAKAARAVEAHIRTAIGVLRRAQESTSDS
ncbi:FadR/GntR family transcriptional regulator [Amycolatopsis anabasis]|uniref:FadR/GntR family transcriptional regulator n=1 Tax=Amycolatopsis anabasis TaxID=1840409 RepID=UPI00131B10D1|nr:FCD domain-containing protein [Amycolatopsis anabasis]